MMISLESYYELKLKGKSEEEIFAQIRSLKRKIASLKRTMEHPDYQDREIIMEPDEEVQLACTRLYLERAKQAYVEAGGVYSMSRTEQRAAEMRDRISSICGIKFSIGGFFGGWTTRELRLEDGSFRMYAGCGLFGSEGVEEIGLSIGRQELIESVKDLHIEEWRKNYSLRRFGIMVLDGEQWNLEVCFEDGNEPLRIYGDNAYPYNFDSLLSLLGLERD